VPPTARHSFPPCSRQCNHDFAGGSIDAPAVPEGVKKGSFMITKNRKKVQTRLLKDHLL
jgi:hypothetical protein